MCFHSFVLAYSVLTHSLSSNRFFRFLSVYLAAQSCLGVTEFKQGLEKLRSVDSSKYFHHIRPYTQSFTINIAEEFLQAKVLNSLVIKPADVKDERTDSLHMASSWFKCLMWSKSEDKSTFCCTLTYLSNTLLIRPRDRLSVVKRGYFLIRSNCYFDCWLGLFVQSGLVSHIPPLIFFSSALLLFVQESLLQPLLLQR